MIICMRSLHPNQHSLSSSSKFSDRLFMQRKNSSKLSLEAPTGAFTFHNNFMEQVVGQFFSVLWSIARCNVVPVSNASFWANSHQISVESAQFTLKRRRTYRIRDA